jgi:LacI family transcriptional regulator
MARGAAAAGKTRRSVGSSTYRRQEIDRVTMKDIARIAGTSLSTVSRSLNDNPSISADTRRRIKAIARSYGFEVNVSARSLATKHNSTVGVIYPESLDNEDNFYYAGVLLRNIREILEEAALDPLISFTGNKKTGESNIRRLIGQGKVDGLLLIQPYIESADLSALKASGLPFVLLHFLPEGIDSEEVSYVYADHIEGGKIATEHLIAGGARRILCLTERERQFRERTEGYRKAHAEAGLPVYENLILSTDATYEAGYRAVAEMRERLSEIDGIFVQADIAAVGALTALRELGVKVPQDIPLVGYDDVRLSSLIAPSLTTVHQPHRELVRRACQRLVEMLRGERNRDPLREVVHPWLVVRESAPALHGAGHLSSTGGANKAARQNNTEDKTTETSPRRSTGDERHAADEG